jgi:hypothetical protein
MEQKCPGDEVECDEFIRQNKLISSHAKNTAEVENKLV